MTKQGIFSKAIREAKEQGFEQRARDLILLRFGCFIVFYSIFCIGFLFISTYLMRFSI